MDGPINQSNSGNQIPAIKFRRHRGSQLWIRYYYTMLMALRKYHVEKKSEYARKQNEDQ